MIELPIDAHLDQIVATLRGGRDLVLEAPPGSGKTTRVPAALAAAGLPGGGRVLVLEPRRIAARLAARRVAEERGETLGLETGYQVRFDSRARADTRLVFLTEALLIQKLLDDAELQGVSVVVFDEFHERTIHADLALMLLREVCATLREDLRIVVMSATLDGSVIAEHLGAERMRVEGRLHPVEVEYVARRSDEPIVRQVVRAVLGFLQQPGALDAGDLLVFLPGVGEIRRALEELAPAAAGAGVDLLALYGDLSLDEQARAVQKGARPRVVLSTNVAETSVTLDGIRTVVDSGLARVLRTDPGSGIDRLMLERISRASAEQRAGRAGRQGPGRCLRLYTRGDQRELLERLEPEILRVDLTEPVLLLKAWGIRDPEALDWLTPPPAGLISRALELLAMLGAIDGIQGGITREGRELIRLPVHPRIGRMLLEGRRRGRGPEVALFAALASARSPLRRPVQADMRSDLLLLRDLFLEARGGSFARPVLSRLGLDPGGVRAIDREERQLARIVVPRSGSRAAAVADDDLLRCVLFGFPDRVARRRGRHSQDALMVGGRAVRLDRNSVVRDAELFVALDVTRVGGERSARVRLASAVERSWLDDVHPGAVTCEDETIWNPERERAEGIRRERYLDLVLAEKRTSSVDPAAAEELLRRAGEKSRFVDSLRNDRLERLLLRLDRLRSARPELSLPAVGEPELRAAIADCCAGRSSLAELRDAPIEDALLARLGPNVAADLRRLCPKVLRLPSGREAKISYAADRPPMVAGKIQEFFGAAESPRILGGSEVVVVDLLAPNSRSVQITSDLAGFWKNLYPKVRREMLRRYPRHPWPEDPFAARPTARPLPRGERN